MPKRISAEFVMETVKGFEDHIAYLNGIGQKTEADETWVKMCQFLTRVREVNGR